MENLEAPTPWCSHDPEALYAFRDPHGIRPLCIGQLPEGRGWVVSSETCGLDIVGASTCAMWSRRDGALHRRGHGKRAGRAAAPQSRLYLQYVYFARPDSVLDGRSVSGAPRHGAWPTRRPWEADLVLGVPDSGVPAALPGYSEASGIPFTDGIVKNRYVAALSSSPPKPCAS